MTLVELLVNTGMITSYPFPICDKDFILVKAFKRWLKFLERNKNDKKSDI